MDDTEALSQCLGCLVGVLIGLASTALLTIGLHAAFNLTWLQAGIIALLFDVLVNAIRQRGK